MTGALNTLPRREIDITFQLGKGAFGAAGFDTVKLTGMRCSVSITGGDSTATAELDLRVWGASQDVMNALTVLNQDYAQRLSKSLNFVTIEAGDEGSNKATVFTGGIFEAWADFSAPPEPCFVVHADTSLVDRYKPGSPTSFQGPVDAAIVMQTIAAKMDPPRRFENDGVQGVMLNDPYFHGSMLEQMQDVRRAADINTIIDEQTGNLVIWPRNGTRGGLVPLVSKATGLVGYPSFTQYGVRVSTLYNNAIAAGGKAKIDSVLQPACGIWYVYLVGHDLEAQVPGGKWFTHFEGSIVPQERGIG